MVQIQRARSTRNDLRADPWAGKRNKQWAINLILDLPSSVMAVFIIDYYLVKNLSFYYKISYDRYISLYRSEPPHLKKIATHTD
jgi:hypothetical protein